MSDWGYSGFLKPLSINDLPKYDSWVRRLLGLDTFCPVKRDMGKIEAEWEKDKYAKLLDYYCHQPRKSFLELRDYMFFKMSVSPIVVDGEVCISRKGRLFLVSVDKWWSLIYENMVFNLAASLTKTDVIIELGCGYGHNLLILRESFRGKKWIGGEYSQNAVELAHRLFKDIDNVSVVPFNYYDKRWEIFENLEERAVVFTRHSIEQLPQAKEAILTLRKYREKIKRVVHLELVPELTDDETLLGLMRQAYVRINDYNTDLLSAIRGAGGSIARTEPDTIGCRPLNPTSLVEWEFES